MPPPADHAAHASAGLRRGAHWFDELESLRGIAILLVYAFHIEGIARVLTPRPKTTSWIGAYLYGGNTGVGLFFVLSGFLLSLPFLVEADGGVRVSRRRYYERRALRILPLYWLVILLGAAVASTSIGDLTRALPYLVFANSVSGSVPRIPPWTNVVWSLATEVQFYLLLPLLPLALRSRRGRRIGLVVLALYGAAYAYYLVGPPHLHWTNVLRLGNSLFGQGWLFLGGIAAGWVYLRHGPQLREALAARAVLANGGADVLLVILLVAFGFVLRWMCGFRGLLGECPPTSVWHLAEAVTWTSVLLAVLLAPLRLKPLVCNAALARIGLLSYSIYLWHVPILRTAFVVFREWI
jgi:peptidoglycan/LPS O-acetylase OafA/YrhL